MEQIINGKTHYQKNEGKGCSKVIPSGAIRSPRMVRGGATYSL
jgi:hypothetical protein